MNWKERAEKVIGDVSLIGRDMGSASHRVSNYVAESFHHIESLEKALAFLADGVRVRQVLVSTYANGVRYEPGEQVFMRHGRILDTASECPELAQWLKEQQEK